MSAFVEPDMTRPFNQLSGANSVATARELEYLMDLTQHPVLLRHHANRSLDSVFRNAHWQYV